MQSEASSQTLSVKVHVHSGDQLYEETHRLAVAEADKESDDEEIMYTVDRGQEIIFNWANNAITHLVPNRKKTHQSARREKGIANEITKDSR